MKAVCGLVLLAAARASTESLSPVTRVVDLLKGLSEKVEAEGKEEETLYNKFVCWANSNVNAKTASNEAANSRIESLNQYIADIEAGRIEFTTERVDLEKEIATLNSDMETASALREKENADYLSAKTEMEQGIAALTEAIKVLDEGTATKESLMAMKNKATAGFAARTAAAVSLSRAVDLGDRFLSKGDARFLRRVLTGSDPVINKDWKKLNRKATFKKSYKARSGEIQETLAKLLQTFETNLAEATAKEEKAQETFDKLYAAKGSQKAAAEEALLKMEKEMGARGLTKAEAQQEVEDLTKQVEDDTKYIEQVKGELETKKEEWTTRSALRSQEAEAISKAIAILHSDDARDLFKKSLESQGYSFMQMASSSQRTHVVAELRRIAKTTRDHRLQSLISVASRGNFDAVLTAIDEMVATLKSQEETELAEKEQCEEDRATDTRAALVASRTIDELTDTITRLQEEIAEKQKQIEESKEEIASIEEELEQAKRLREDQAAAYATAKADDEAAVELIKQAHDVLTTFYSDNNLMLVSNKAKVVQAPISEAGEAPPPPPSTWETPYAGATGESTGILSVLKMIENDIGKDIVKADEAEAASIKSYEEMKAEQEEAIADLQTTISNLEGDIATKEGEIVTAEGDKATEKESLANTIKKLKDAESGCDFISVNFQLRSSNRQVEIDGLEKAKAILSGATFTEAQDPGELAPGNAFVQKKGGLRGSVIRKA